MVGIKINLKKQIKCKTNNLDFLTDASFPGVNRLFVLSCENEVDWESYKKYYLPTVKN